MKYRFDATTPTGKTLTFHRYSLPNVKLEGWFVITLGSDGSFTAFSDFGDYMHLWGRHYGDDDFRQFFLRIDDDYLLGKIAKKEFARDKTVKFIRQAICAERRMLSITREQAREEWELLDETLGDRDVDAAVAQARWCEETEFGDSEYFCRDWSAGDVAFVQRVINQRLRPMIAAELEAEGLLDPGWIEDLRKKGMLSPAPAPAAMPEAVGC